MTFSLPRETPALFRFRGELRGQNTLETHEASDWLIDCRPLNEAMDWGAFISCCHHRALSPITIHG